MDIENVEGLYFLYLKQFSKYVYIQWRTSFSPYFTEPVYLAQSSRFAIELVGDVS